MIIVEKRMTYELIVNPMPVNLTYGKMPVRYYCCIHACISRKSGGGGTLWSSLARFTCALISKFCRLTGAEGELQLRPLLPTGEWKSRKIPGRGAPSRRLSFQWTRRVPGGKENALFFLSFYFFIKSFFTSICNRVRTVRCCNCDKRYNADDVYISRIIGFSSVW